MEDFLQKLQVHYDIFNQYLDLGSHADGEFNGMTAFISSDYGYKENAENQVYLSGDKPALIR